MKNFILVLLEYFSAFLTKGTKHPVGVSDQEKNCELFVILIKYVNKI